MRKLYGDAIQFLVDNLDLVRWAVCLTDSYSERFRRSVLVEPLIDCLTGLIDGTGALNDPTFIGRFTKTVTGPGGLASAQVASGVGGSAWSFEVPRSDGSVGVIIPMEHRWWLDRIEMYNEPPSLCGRRLCGVVGAVATILHEFVHICARGLGVHWEAPDGPGPAWLRADHRRTCDQRVRPPGVPIDLSGLACGEPTRMVSSAFWWATAKRFGDITSDLCCQDYANDSRFLISDCDARSWRNGCNP